MAQYSVVYAWGNHDHEEIIEAASSEEAESAALARLAEPFIRVADKKGVLLLRPCSVEAIYVQAVRR